MATYHEITKEQITEEDGKIVKHTTSEKKEVLKNQEPDFIKLYTDMWCRFNQIPEKWRPLFMALVFRMSYASLKSPTGGQIVYTIGNNAEEIMAECGWKTKDPLYRGLTALCECQAIRKIGRGQYQISPHYAGRGGWYYNASLKQGGVKDLIATFDFANHKVDTQIVWGSTDKDVIGRNVDEVIATRTIAIDAPAEDNLNADTAGASHPIDRKKQEDKAS